MTAYLMEILKLKVPLYSSDQEITLGNKKVLGLILKELERGLFNKI
jgi:hypothetical protein